MIDYRVLVQRQKQRLAICEPCENRVHHVIYDVCKANKTCKCSLVGLSLRDENICPEKKWVA